MKRVLTDQLTDICTYEESALNILNTRMLKVSKGVALTDQLRDICIYSMERALNILNMLKVSEGVAKSIFHFNHFKGFPYSKLKMSSRQSCRKF